MNETGIRREPCGDALPRSRKSATGENHRCTHRRVLSVNACSIRGDVKNILLPPPEARVMVRGIQSLVR